MYEKTLIILILIVAIRSEEISSVKNVKNANFLSPRLSTILPYLSLHNDQHLIKNNPKKSLFLLMPLSQTRDKQEETKETKIQKTKRCNTPSRKDRLLSLSAKEYFTRARNKNPNRNINGEMPKQNSNTRTFIKNIKYSQDNSATSNKMKAEMHENKTFLGVIKNNAKNISLKSREKTNKCNTEKCVCYCKDKCFSESLKKSSLGMLGSSRKDKGEKINHLRREKDGNARSNILPQISPLHYKDLYELYIPSLINSFPTQYYRDRGRNIPRVPVFYDIPDVSPHVIGNERKFVNNRFPFTPFKDRLNFLGSNVRNQHLPIICQNSYSCPPVIYQRNQVESLVSTTLPSTSYIDATTSMKIKSDLELYDSTRIIGKDQEHHPKLITEAPNDYVGMSANSEMETNFYSSYSTDITDVTEESIASFSNLDETMKKLEDSTGTIRNQDDDPFKLTSFSTDYVGTNSVPVTIYPSITHNGKFINMEECIKLFGRDVCVLSTTSSGMFTEQIQENNLNEHSTIRIPEYIIQSSTKTGTTLNNVNYANKFETTDLTSKSFTNGIEKSIADLNKNLESTNTESYTNINEVSPIYQYAESIKQIYEPDNENKSSNNVENINISKKLMDQTDDKIMKAAQNKLGKSKNYVTKLLLSPNDKETTKPTSNKELFYFTSHACSNNEEANNFEVGQQNWITNADSWKNTHHKEETTIISCDYKTEHNINEKNRNLKETYSDMYPGKDILQEQFKEESTTISHNSETRYNFEEETINGLIDSKINTYPEEENLQEQLKEITTVTLGPEIEYDFEDESTNNLERSNTETYSGNGILQRQFEKETTTNSPDFKTEYNFGDETINGLIESRINTYPEEETLQEQPKEITTIDPETEYNFEEESTNNLGKSNTEIYSGNEILQQQYEKETTADFKTGYNFEGKDKKMEIKTSIYPGKEILGEQPTTMQYFDYEKSSNLNNKEDTTNSFETITDSSTRKLPFCDNTLLLNSIKKVINNFASDTRLTKTKDFDENILQMQDKSLLPEILQVPNLENILLTPQVENMILEKVKDIVSNVTAIPRKDFTNNWSHGIIKNALRNVLEVFSDFRQKYPPMTVEEHQFHNGQWTTNLVTLAPVPYSKLSMGNSENLQDSIRDLLSSSAIVSQTNHYIVRNIIVQTMKNSLNNDENEKVDDSIIRALNDVLQTLKSSEDIDTSKKNNEFVIDEENINMTFPQEMSTDDYEIKTNASDSILDKKQNLDTEEDTKIGDKKMQTANYQKAKALKNNILITSESLDLSELCEEDKSTCISKETSSISNEDIHNMRENIKDCKNEDNHRMEKKIQDQVSSDKKNFITEKNTKIDTNRMQTIDCQGTKTLENNTNILVVSESPNLLESSEKDKNMYIEEETPYEDINKIRENIRDEISDGIKKIDAQDDKEKKLAEPLKTITTYHKAILQNNPNILAISVKSNLTEAEELNEEENIRNTLAATTILSTIAKDSHEREKIVDVTKIKDINMQSERETDNSDLRQQSISNLILAKELSDEHNTESIKEHLFKYDGIDLTKIHEKNNDDESTINYNSPEVSKYLENHRINDESFTTATTFMQPISPYNSVTEWDNKISENMAGTANAREEIKYTLDEKTLPTSSDNLILFTDVKYENQESTVTSSIDEIDPIIILERIKYNLPPIKYYSPEILKYMKTHHIDDENVKVITAPANFMQETSPDYTQVSNDIISQNTVKDVADEMKYTWNSNGETSITSTSNLISSVNGNNENHELKVAPSTNETILRLQQNFTTKNNIVKIHEVSTEVQRTYAKTTYFKAMPADDSEINSASSAYEVTNSKNKNSNSNNNNNLIDNEMDNIDYITEANEIIVSSTESSSLDDSSDPFFSSVASNNILELQKSQLYYINDDVKLPLEIIKLKNGSYALSISKNICEQILKRKCPCCIPLQGHIVRTSRKNYCQEDMHTMDPRIIGEKDRENIYVSDVKIDYQSTQSSSTMTTAMSTRENISRMQKAKKEEKKTKAHRLWKRNNDNDMNNDNLSTMSIVNFATKYNLLLDFNEEEVLLNETELYNKTQNYDKSLIKSVKGFEYDQSEERNLDNNLGIKKDRLLDENKDTINKIQDLVNDREKTNTLKTNFSEASVSQFVNLRKNSIEFDLRKINKEANQSEIAQGLKSRKLETTDGILNINTKQKINSKNQERNPILTKINISEEETKMNNEEIKWDKSNIEKGNIKVFHKKEKREHEETELIDEKQNKQRIKSFEESRGRPYRYQRNTNGIENKRAELVKSMLYWVKSLFLDK